MWEIDQEAKVGMWLWVNDIASCLSLVVDMSVQCVCCLLKEFLGEGNGDPLQYSCLENPIGGEAWKAAVHGVTKSRTQLSDFTFILHFHALEKDMATHSSVLAWGIPGMEEPGGLPSMGSHRVGHYWSDFSSKGVPTLFLLNFCNSLTWIKVTWLTIHFISRLFANQAEGTVYCRNGYLTCFMYKSHEPLQIELSNKYQLIFFSTNVIWPWTFIRFFWERLLEIESVWMFIENWSRFANL